MLQQIYLLSITKHYFKRDRKIFNHPHTHKEFSNGFVAHQLLFRDCEAARYVPLSATNSPGLENIVKFKIPVPVYASFHVVNGPPGQTISGSVWINTFDCYRVNPVPKVTWFTLV